MRTMENLEYSYILKELEVLVGKRFEKIQEILEGKLSLKIGKERVIIELGTRMNIAYKLEEGRSDTGFIQKIRKELKGFKLEKVFQHNNDRVIVFEFSGKEGKKEFIFEMFAKGNAALVSGGTIICSYKNEKWADREVKTRAEYNFPKSNIVENLREAVSDKYVISCMMRLPLGKRYAKEILGKLKIDEKTPGNELGENDIKNIEKEIEKMNKNLNPVGFYKNGKIIDYGLVEFEEHRNLEKKEFKSLSEVSDEYYGNAISEEKSERIKKLEKRLGEQEKQLEELRKREKEYKEIGDKVYEKYSEIEEILKDKDKKIKEIEI